MTATQTKHEVVSNAAWIEARKALLLKEKELTRQRDELARRRRELPWETVEKRYVFQGPSGEQTLCDLFQGRTQLIVYHFMFGPDWNEGCPGCSFVCDHLDGSIIHLANRDVTLVVVSRAPLDQIRAFQKRMGWKFKWVSSLGTDFNFDYGVSFTEEQRVDGKVEYNYTRQALPKEEAPGLSVFRKDDSGAAYHTYSTYGRGLDSLLGAYNLLDLTSKGRNEGEFAQPMSWLRHHDRYEDSSATCCHGKA
jgi:predicted dithiol-disulfide oxidoreductase (DUF899 family)